MKHGRVYWGIQASLTRGQEPDDFNVGRTAERVFASTSLVKARMEPEMMAINKKVSYVRTVKM